MENLENIKKIIVELFDKAKDFDDRKEKIYFDVELFSNSNLLIIRTYKTTDDGKIYFESALIYSGDSKSKGMKSTLRKLLKSNLVYTYVRGKAEYEKYELEKIKNYIIGTFDKEKGEN